jgi:hypothetical protein
LVCDIAVLAVNNKRVMMSKMSRGVAFGSNERLGEFVGGVVPAENIIRREDWFFGGSSSCLGRHNNVREAL